MTFSNCHVTTELKFHVTFWVGQLHPDSTSILLSLGAIGFVNVDFHVFNLSHDHVVHVSFDFLGGIPSS